MKTFIHWIIVAIIGCGSLDARASQKVIECKLVDFVPSTWLTIPVKDNNQCKWQCNCSGDPGQKTPHKEECPEGQTPVDKGQTCAVSGIYLYVLTPLPTSGKCPTSIQGADADGAKSECKDACLEEFPKELRYDCGRKRSGGSQPPGQ